MGFLFITGFSYFQQHPGGFGLEMSFNTFTWIPLSITLGFGLFCIVKSRLFIHSTLSSRLAVCTGIMLLPAYFPGSESLIDLGRFYALVAGLLFLVCLHQLRLDSRQIIQLSLFILLGVSLQAAFGWFQALELLPEGFLGYSRDLPRPFGIFRQPNVMASFMATGLALSAYLLGKLPEENRISVWYRFLCFAVPILVLPVILVLNSRVGWLGALIGVGLLGPWLVRRPRSKDLLCWLIALTIGIGLGLLHLTTSEAGLAQAANKLRIDPVRMEMYPIAFRLFLEHWMTGVGFGNFEASFNEFAAGLYAAGSAEPIGVRNLHHPHNELLFWAVEGGIVSLLGLLLAAWFVLQRALALDWPKAMAFVGLLFPIALHTQTEYPFYHSAIHWLLFIFIIFMLDRESAEPRTLSVRTTVLYSTAGVLIPVAVSLFMVTTLHAAAVLQRYERVAGTSPETLFSIVNPMVWRDRLLWAVRTNLMYAGIARGDRSEVEPFIELVRENLEHKPRWQQYQDLIFAHDFLGQVEQADAVMAEAQYRYPQNDFQRLEGGTLVLRSFSPQSQPTAAIE